MMAGVGRRPRRPRLHATRGSLARVALGAALAVGATRDASAQSARGVLLRLHPRVGDTLHTRLEQVTEISSTRGDGGGKPMTTSVILLARTIVQASHQSTTTVLTLVDSAAVQSSDAHGAAMSAQAVKALRGQRLVVQLAEDGSVESARDARGVAVARDVAEAMAAMPAVFPRRPVAVGERWQRDMPLPTAGPLGSTGTAQVHAEFRLDSLARTGDLAFVSMHGDIASDSGQRSVDLSGSITGAMQIDRGRGWMTDSYFTLLLRSVLTPPPGVAMHPMKFVTRVTQRLRTMDKR